MRSYPIMLDLADKRVVIIGASKVALRKIEGLVGCGADITVIAPDPRPEHLDESIDYIQRKYAPDLIEAATLVYACTDNRELNSRISADARKQKILVNSVDDPQNCDFFAPSQVIRDDLTIAVGTSGNAPSIAKYLRKKIDKTVEKSFGRYVRFVGHLRKELKNRNLPPEAKEKILAKLASDELIGIYETQGFAGLKRHIPNIEFPDEDSLSPSHRIICVGINHKTAPVEIREKFAFDTGRINNILSSLKNSWPDSQFMVLSTCNRSEIYCVRELHSHPRNEELPGFLKSLSTKPCTDAKFYVYEDKPAVEHIFKVAAGLDSMIPGEDQIVSQIKDAWNTSIAAGASGKQLNLLLQTALHTAKHIRHETKLAYGRTSVASAAVDMIENYMKTIDGKKVFVVGAGQTASLVIKHLQRLGKCDLKIIRKNPTHKNELPADRIPDAISQGDIVICASNASQPVITADMLVKTNREKPLLIIDLGVPRNVEPAARTLRCIKICDIDSLTEIVAKNRNDRLESARTADLTIARHTEKLFAEMVTHQVSPTLQAMYHRTKMIEKQELAAAFNKLPDSPQKDANQKLLRHTVHRTVRRILHPLVEKLRTSSSNPKIKKYLSAVEELFDLHD